MFDKAKKIVNETAHKIVDKICKKMEDRCEKLGDISSKNRFVQIRNLANKAKENNFSMSDEQKERLKKI